MVDGTILLNFTNTTNGSVNYSAGFNYICTCPGLNTDFGFLAILSLFLILAFIPDKWNGIKINIDKDYYMKFISIISAIVLLSFSTKNLINSILFLASFALLGSVIGSRHFKRKHL
jgi:hypothetical protein